MRHLFWIICGVVLVSIIAAWLLVVPTEKARDSKNKLDQQSKDLKELEKRADRGDPPGLFDAENPADTQRLANDYLITESWKRVLQPHVEKYEKQLADIKAQLLGRGVWLHKPVTSTKNVLEWYSDYIKVSEALIVRLREATCMKRAAETDVISASNESPATVRASVGLFTKSGAFPDPKEHAQLTARLRAMELVADRLIAARVAIADSPVVGPTGPSEDRARASAVIAAVEWVGGGEGEAGLRQLSTAISSQVLVRGIGLRLTLDGPLSALLATTAVLERNDAADRPLIAITSSSLSRRESAAAGERYDVADDNVHLVLSLEIIEFAEPSADAPAAPGPGAPGGFMGGVPGGFMGGPPGGNPQAQPTPTRKKLKPGSEGGD